MGKKDEDQDTGVPSPRDALRAKVFASKNKSRKKKILKLFGQDVEIRQPTIGEITELANQAKMDEAGGSLALALIQYAYVPGTDEKLFEKGDVDSILSFPADQWVDDMNTAIADMTGVDLEAARKNLEKTASS